MSSVYRQARERASRALARAAVLCLALAASGCSSAGPVASRLAADDVTGSVPAIPSAPMALSPDDWSHAQAALTRALDPLGPAAPVVWDNPATGLHGEITPIGAVYDVEGQPCRAFLAQIGVGAPVRRLQGRGCRAADGLWAVSDLKPFET